MAESRDQRRRSAWRQAAGLPGRAARLVVGEIDLRREVVKPVVVNLLTALLAFLALWLFRDQLYQAIRPRERVADFPLHSVLEAYADENGVVVGKLYIANRNGEHGYSRAALVTILSSASKDDQVEQDPDIHLRLVAGPNRKLEVTPDLAFNHQSGTLEVVPPTGAGDPWTIRVRQIEAGALLRATLTTNLRRPLTRDQRLSYPFDLDVPGKAFSDD